MVFGHPSGRLLFSPSLFLLLLLLPHVCIGGRYNLSEMAAGEHRDSVIDPRYVAMGFLPRGRPFPPSGPSKRHNSNPTKSTASHRTTSP
ncbi:unnamed protein product [Spirodela intermedia]|uniref:Uncharacterized protein n=2 Tax=Spirodela intermedia TaxID=51605 RepID=A0A7I8L3U9_SPIIN|nr:unnamed protein product [Spirodela intermedia]